MKGIKFLAEFGQPDLFANRSTVGFELVAMLLTAPNKNCVATNRSLRPRERRRAQMGLRLSKLYDTPDARRFK